MQGHYDKMAGKNQHKEQNKTPRTPRRNRHLEQKTLFLCFSDFSFLFSFLFITSYIISPVNVDVLTWYGQ